MSKKAISLDNLTEGTSPEPDAVGQITPEPSVEPTPAPEPEPEPTPQEPVSQEPVAEPEVTPPVEEPKVEEPAFDLEFFNKTLKKEYTSVDQIQADLDKQTMESEYEEMKAKYDDLNQTYEILTEQVDQSAPFDDDDLKVAMFKKANPKKDPSIAQKLFSTTDLSEIDDLEVVKMARKFRSKKLPGNEADLEAAILEELNIDPETPRNEWPNTAQIRLASMADGERDTFDKLKEGIVLPEKVNLDELKAQRKQAADERVALITDTWSKAAETAVKDTSSLKIPIGVPAEGEEQKFFEWDLGTPPTEEVDALRQEYINFGVPPSDEAQQAFDKSLELSLKDKHLPDIMKKYGDDIAARMEEDFLERSHNPNPIKDTQRTDGGSEAEKALKDRTSFATEGLGAAFTGHPLFNIKT